MQGIGVLLGGESARAKAEKMIRMKGCILIEDEASRMWYRNYMFY